MKANFRRTAFVHRAFASLFPALSEGCGSAARSARKRARSPIPTTRCSVRFRNAARIIWRASAKSCAFSHLRNDCRVMNILSTRAAAQQKHSLQADPRGHMSAATPGALEDSSYGARHSRLWVSP